MKGVLEKYSSYNLWANRKLVSFLKGAENEILDIVIPSSFGTIKKTLLHIWDAEYIWYERLKGEWVKSWPSESFSGTSEDFFNSFLKQSEELMYFVSGISEEKLFNNFHYRTLDGTEFTNSVYDTILHVFNHSTYHLGQIITMLRYSGLKDFDSTDYITYIRELQT